MSAMCALPCFLLSLCALTPVAAADRFGDLREYIRAELVEQSVPSIAVAVAQNGKVIWEEGFGWADREQRIEVNEHTMYSLAWISKPITTTGLMTLVQAGKVDLDKPVNDYLWNAKLRARVGDASADTVRRVADHTSGRPLHIQFFYADEPFRRPSMDETILRYGNLITAPGEQYAYSNLGYGVLDYVIERVSGKSYAEFMRREVFLPLALTRTSVDIGPGLASYAATRYGANGLALPFYDSDHPGASAVYSSAHDLVRFGLFHLKAHLPDQKPILNDALIDEMYHRAAMFNQRNRHGGGYGTGFFVDQQHGYSVVSHSGGMPGVSTQLLPLPEQGIAVVVLCNASAFALVEKITDRIVATLLPKWKPETATDQEHDAPFAVLPSLAGTWRGEIHTYTGNVPFELTFSADGEVHSKVGDQLSTLVSEPRFDQGAFTGAFNARIGTPDTERYAYEIHASLRLRGEVLNGGVATRRVARLERADGRVRNSLTHWSELRKVR